VASGVILYGPPGSGKDTITGELSRIAPEFAHFRRLKSGPGRVTGYRMATPETVEQLSRTGELLYRHSRYGAEYAIDRPAVESLVECGRVPVVHMGQVAGVTAVSVFPILWTTVLLWCPREVSEARSRGRGDSDVDARLKAWEETRTDLLQHRASKWSLVIATDRETPEEAARRVIAAVSAKAPAEPRDILQLVGS
jgi:guanylate kinase